MREPLVPPVQITAAEIQATYTPRSLSIKPPDSAAPADYARLTNLDYHAAPTRSMWTLAMRAVLTAIFAALFAFLVYYQLHTWDEAKTNKCDDHLTTWLLGSALGMIALVPIGAMMYFLEGGPRMCVAGTLLCTMIVWMVLGTFWLDRTPSDNRCPAVYDLAYGIVISFWAVSVGASLLVCVASAFWNRCQRRSERENLSVNRFSFV